MKIREIRPIPLYLTTPETDWPRRFGVELSPHCLVEVLTDEGVAGLGSVYTSGALVAAALELLRPLVIGASALDPAAVSEHLHQNTFWQGRGGTLTHTISGLDLALWDILGKVCRQPAGRLLGGRVRDSVKPYGSLLLAEPEVLRERLHAGLALGFKAFKLGWGPFGRCDARTDERLVQAARECVGPDVELMVDAGGSDAHWPHGYKWALETARMLAEYQVAWFEEPLRPDDLEGYVRLTEHAPLPIAGGEVLTRRQAFLPWIERRAVDYIQPDVTKVGGLSELRRIGEYADDHAILLIPHGWNTAVGLAADLQWASAAPQARWVEYMTPAPLIEDLFLDPPRLDGAGRLRIPDAPGLGFRWNPEGVAKHARGVTLSPSAL